ncbi:MAG TPA: PH domain-containing protein [Candidatus Limnocylindria bacterium]|nr:PH domain-containing protein [Candidatus Limnocylindria bacterium]
MDTNGRARPRPPVEPAPQTFEATLVHERAIPRVSPRAELTHRPVAVPPDLAAMLLPSESLTYAAGPHPVVYARPLAAIAIIGVALAVALTYHVTVLEHGHHVSVPLLDARLRIGAWAIGGIAVLRALFSLARATAYYLGFRVMTTNRRVFEVRGFLGRRVRPLGNTAMAGSSLVQGILGRIFNYGTIVMKDATIRDMRDPIALYREMQGVANGLDGDRWAPVLRQTQMP